MKLVKKILILLSIFILCGCTNKESFDDTKFEIVDISYGYQDHVDKASKHADFLVTYRSR